MDTSAGVVIKRPKNIILSKLYVFSLSETEIFLYSSKRLDGYLFVFYKYARITGI